ncbi:MarR family transcriptional regulator [Pseudonocardiaceae bacterium YIM PH 21723]|nr:MarR family transcriptional regulator [Pseudonocardiaceae bacterium YIM PH 21723]
MGTVDRVSGEHSTEPLSDGERAAWLAVLSAADDLRALVTGEVTPASGLSSADFQVLSRLQIAPGHRMVGLTTMAAELDWSPSRLSHHLKRMKARGLIDLSYEVNGQLVVRATEAAVQIMEPATAQHAQAVRRHFLSQATEDERRVLVELARRIHARRAL